MRPIACPTPADRRNRVAASSSLRASAVGFRRTRLAAGGRAYAWNSWFSCDSSRCCCQVVYRAVNGSCHCHTTRAQMRVKTPAPTKTSPAVRATRRVMVKGAASRGAVAAPVRNRAGSWSRCRLILACRVAPAREGRGEHGLQEGDVLRPKLIAVCVLPPFRDAKACQRCVESVPGLEVSEAPRREHAS